jgi:predicted GNAT family N-acyltransferase
MSGTIQLFEVQGTPCTMKMVTTAYDGMSASYIRFHVFVEEQGVPLDIEMDGSDQTATSFLMFLDHAPIGTLRYVRINADTLQLGRIALLKPYRNQGYGKALMRWFDTYALSIFKKVTLTLHAQRHVQSFYEACGYRPIGEPFIEAGIDHIEMKKDVG